MYRFAAMPAVLTASLFLVPAAGHAHGARLPSSLRKADPIVCGDERSLVITRRSIRTDGHGIELSGKCEVTIVDSRIVAGKIGILVHGATVGVEIRNSVIEGAEAAFEVDGKGEIRVESSTIRGATRVRGRAEIVDGGENVLGGVLSVRGGVGVSRHGMTLSSDDFGHHDLRDAAETEVERPRPAKAPRTMVVEVDGEEVTVVIRPAGILQLKPAVEPTPAAEPTRVDDEEPGAGPGGEPAADVEGLLRELGAVEDAGDTRIVLPGELFDYDSATLRPQAAETLARVARVLQQRQTDHVHVDGHIQLAGDQSRNREVTELLAVAVMHWLHTEGGVPAHLLFGRGMGGKKPLALNFRPDGSDNLENQAKNRRVEIRLTPQP